MPILLSLTNIQKLKLHRISNFKAFKGETDIDKTIKHIYYKAYQEALYKL